MILMLLVNIVTNFMVLYID